MALWRKRIISIGFVGKYCTQSKEWAQAMIDHLWRDIYDPLDGSEKSHNKVGPLGWGPRIDRDEENRRGWATDDWNWSHRDTRRKLKPQPYNWMRGYPKSHPHLVSLVTASHTSSLLKLIMRHYIEPENFSLPLLIHTTHFTSFCSLSLGDDHGLGYSFCSQTSSPGSTSLHFCFFLFSESALSFSILSHQPA